MIRKRDICPLFFSAHERVVTPQGLSKMEMYIKTNNFFTQVHINNILYIYFMQILALKNSQRHTAAIYKGLYSHVHLILFTSCALLCQHQRKIPKWNKDFRGLVNYYEEPLCPRRYKNIEFSFNKRNNLCCSFSKSLAVYIRQKIYAFASASYIYTKRFA